MLELPRGSRRLDRLRYGGTKYAGPKRFDDSATWNVDAGQERRRVYLSKFTLAVTRLTADLACVRKLKG